MCPDTRQHRGAHPEDPRLFAADQLPALRAATFEYSWLLSRGYPTAAALKLCGDRHGLTERQRTAVSRAACADASRARRQANRLEVREIAGQALAVDGFNLIITLEAALSRGVLLRCRDGCTRDMASVHGSYRSVEETEPAIRLAGEALERLGASAVRWLLDQPISNSGRLAARLREMAAERGWPWTVETVFNPDTNLIASERIVVSSDSAVIEGAGCWTDLTSHLVGEQFAHAWLVDLRD